MFSGNALSGGAVHCLDIYFTSRAVWSFNADYITGIKLSNLPLEEVLFFLLFPIAVFIYACIRAYFPKTQKKNGPIPS